MEPHNFRKQYQICYTCASELKKIFKKNMLRLSQDSSLRLGQNRPEYHCQLQLHRQMPFLFRLRKQTLLLIFVWLFFFELNSQLQIFFVSLPTVYQEANRID